MEISVEQQVGYQNRRSEDRIQGSNFFQIFFRISLSLSLDNLFSGGMSEREGQCGEEKGNM